MEAEQVYAQFLLLTGLSEESGAAWKPFCEAARARLEMLLLPGVDPADPRLTLAAAGEAYCRYSLAQPGSGAQSVSVGGVSVSETGGSIQNAAALRDELLAGAAGLLDCGTATLRAVGP